MTAGAPGRPTRAARVDHYRRLLDVYDRMRRGEVLSAGHVREATGINANDAAALWRHILQERLPARANRISDVPISVEFPGPPLGLTNSELRLYEALVAAWPVPARAADLYAAMWGIPVEQASDAASVIRAHASNLRRKGVRVVCRLNIGYLLEVEGGS